jgi:hypothetical protein
VLLNRNLIFILYLQQSIYSNKLHIISNSGAVTFCIQMYCTPLYAFVRWFPSSCFILDTRYRHASLSFKAGCQGSLWPDGMCHKELVQTFFQGLQWYGCANILFFLYLCSVVLFPVAITFFITWWFIQFVDGFFSPLYAKLGFDIFGNCLCSYLVLVIVYHYSWSIRTVLIRMFNPLYMSIYLQEIFVPMAHICTSSTFKLLKACK